MIKYSIILFSFFSVASLLIVPAFAYEINYDFNGTKLMNNPTVCVVKSSDPNLNKKMKEMIMTETKVSISEWENKLKRTESKNKEIWEINYVEITSKNNKSDEN